MTQAEMTIAENTQSLSRSVFCTKSTDPKVKIIVVRFQDKSELHIQYKSEPEFFLGFSTKKDK